MRDVRIFTVHAVILSRRNWSEADRIITYFSREHGKGRAIAKGVRKITSRRAGHLEVFNKLKMTIHHSRSFDGISEVATLTSFRGLRENLITVSHAYYVCELTDKLTPMDQAYESVYYRLNQVLTDLAAAKDQVRCALLVHEFAVFLLTELGFLAPEKKLTPEQRDRYIERIIERRLLSTKLIRKLT